MAGFSKTLTALYDEGGRRTRLTHPDGQAFTSAYDALDRLSGVYEGVGTATSLDTFAYNNQGLPSTRTERLGSGVTYGWDAVGRLTSQADAFAGGTGNVGWTFGHSPASQIATETRDNDSYAFGGLAAVNRNYAVNGLNQ